MLPRAHANLSETQGRVNTNRSRIAACGNKIVQTFATFRTRRRISHDIQGEVPLRIDRFLIEIAFLPDDGFEQNRVRTLSRRNARNKRIVIIADSRLRLWASSTLIDS